MCVCVLIQNTHSPLSHYQLAFHPLSHPSVQMVLKAAPSLPPSLLSTLLEKIKNKREKKGYVRDRLEPNRGGLQIGYQVDLQQRAESRSVTSLAPPPFFSSSIFCSDENNSTKEKGTKFKSYTSISVQTVPTGCLPSMSSMGGRSSFNAHCSLFWLVQEREISLCEPR